MSMSPKHVRMPRPKRDIDFRYSTKSQLASIDERKVKNMKLFSLPLDKDYFNRKIKKTVKHYFQARRTSMGHNFNDTDFTKDKKIIQEIFKNEQKNPKILIELDQSCNPSGKLSNNKALSSRVASKTFVFTGLSSRETASPKDFFQTKNSQRKDKQKKISPELPKAISNKVDQGLQTDDQPLIEIQARPYEPHITLLDFPVPNSFI